MPAAPLYNEKEILLHISQSDELAFERLFHHYKNKVYSFAMHYSGQPEAAEEIVQDVFLRVWQHREQLPEIEKFEAWLFTISRNLSFNVLKKRAEEGTLRNTWQQDTRNVYEQAGDPLLHKQYQQLLQQAVAQLPVQQKQVYIWSQQDGLNHDEIANRMKLSRTTVKKHLVLAMKSIRAYILSRLLLLLIQVIATGFLKIFASGYSALYFLLSV